MAREIEIHSHLQHEHIIQLYGAFEDNKHVYLVQEYASGTYATAEVAYHGSNQLSKNTAWFFKKSESVSYVVSQRPELPYVNPHCWAIILYSGNITVGVYSCNHRFISESNHVFIQPRITAKEVFAFIHSGIHLSWFQRKRQDLELLMVVLCDDM